MNIERVRKHSAVACTAALLSIYGTGELGGERRAVEGQMGAERVGR